MPHGWTRYFRSVRYILLGSVLACAVLPLVLGCNTTDSHKILTFFFDGVPEPGAPPRPRHRILAQAAARSAATTNPTHVSMPVLSIHKAYSEHLCDACHRTATGEIADLSLVTAATCYKCHRQVPTEYAFMHGPVAVGGCLMCHVPHESAEVHLLRNKPRALCITCHDGALLGDKPQEHRDSTISCLDCHSGHGGKVLPFLKPRPAATTPASTAPGGTTLPQPATRPGVAPVPRLLRASAPLAAEAPL